MCTSLADCSYIMWCRVPLFESKMFTNYYVCISGYKAQDTRIYKLEPEDLTPSNLKEIEDINTTRGAITQMSLLKTHQEKSNQWGSKTGTTEEDIEMFEKKCTKFEEITLGDKIDLKALERNYIKDKDDEVRVKHEGATMTVRRKNGTGQISN